MTCLTVMAYDWFASICHLLNCPVVINLYLYVFLVLMSFLVIFLEAQLHILVALHITSFKRIEITNFFDPSQVFSLSCTDTFINKTLKYIVSTVNGLLPISEILFFYYKIFPQFWEFHNQEGRINLFNGWVSSVSGLFILWNWACNIYWIYHITFSQK
jgi:olfactory receptor